MKILHISDIHIGAGNESTRPIKRLLLSLGEAIKTHQPDVLAISGDIGYQGRAASHKMSQDVLQEMVKISGVPKQNVILCPGNHDIVDRSFRSFDSLSYAIRGDAQCTFAESHARAVILPAAAFVVVNSAHHLNYGFGLIDEQAVRVQLEALSDVEPSMPRIIVVHHHLIPMLRDDTSTTRNASALLNLAIEHRVSLILHGHQHMSGGIRLKGTLACYGVTSFNFKDGANGAFLFKSEGTEFVMQRLVYDENNFSGKKGFAIIGRENE